MWLYRVTQGKEYICFYAVCFCLFLCHFVLIHRFLQYTVYLEEELKGWFCFLFVLLITHLFLCLPVLVSLLAPALLPRYMCRMLYVMLYVSVCYCPLTSHSYDLLLHLPLAFCTVAPFTVRLKPSLIHSSSYVSFWVSPAPTSGLEC